MVLFPNRGMDPKERPGYEDLLASPRVCRIYLDELTDAQAATPGLRILRLLTTPEDETRSLVSQLFKSARQDTDCERAKVIVELTEEGSLRRFTELDREEIRRMFHLHDLRKSRVWQEAHEEGEQMRNQKLVHRWRAEGKSLKEIAELLGLPVPEVRRLARRKMLD